VLVTIIIALLLPNLRLLPHDFPKKRNLPKIFIRSFANVAPDVKKSGMLVINVDSVSDTDHHCLSGMIW